MAPTQQYQVNVFAVIALIILVVVFIYIVVVSIYFFNLMNLKPPSRSTSTFLFSVAVCLAIILFFITIYALWEIFAYKAFIYNTIPIVSAPVTTPAPIYVSPAVQQPQAVQVVQQPQYITPQPQVVQQPQYITPQPQVVQQPQVSQTMYVTPTYQLHQSPLQQEIAAFSRAVSQ